MSLKDVLNEQIERNKKNIKAYNRRINRMPKGTLHEKKRGNKRYYYLKYRDENGKRVDEYVSLQRVDEVRKQILKRDEYKVVVMKLKEDIEVAKKGLR